MMSKAKVKQCGRWSKGGKPWLPKRKKDHDKLEKKDNRPKLVIVQPDSCIQVMVVDVQGREKGKATRWGR